LAAGARRGRRPSPLFSPLPLAGEGGERSERVRVTAPPAHRWKGHPHPVPLPPAGEGTHTTVVRTEQAGRIFGGSQDFLRLMRAWIPSPAGYDCPAAGEPCRRRCLAR